jgi:hypothetical protein
MQGVLLSSLVLKWLVFVTAFYFVILQNIWKEKYGDRVFLVKVFMWNCLSFKQNKSVPVTESLGIMLVVSSN